MLSPPPLPRTLEASLRDIDSTRPEIRLSAIEDLTRHARANEEVRAKAIPLLSARLKDDAHPRVRGQAAVALSDLKATDALPAILMAVEDDDAHVREMAISTLGEIGDSRALPRLRRALRDIARPEVRYQAIIAFCRVDGTEPSEIDAALLDAAGDDDEAIVHIALRVAEERLDQGKHGAATPDARLTARARELVETGAPAVALVAAIYVAKALRSAPEALAARELVGRVVRGERLSGSGPQPDKEDEHAAIELAGELGMTALTSQLEKRVWGLGRFVRDTYPFHARIALARLGHARAIREILGELGSRKREEVEGAIVSAGRARITAAKEPISRLTALAADPELVAEALARIEAADERA